MTSSLQQLPQGNFGQVDLKSYHHKKKRNLSAITLQKSIREYQKRDLEKKHQELYKLVNGEALDPKERKWQCQICLSGVLLKLDESSQTPFLKLTPIISLTCKWPKETHTFTHYFHEECAVIAAEGAVTAKTKSRCPQCTAPGLLIPRFYPIIPELPNNLTAEELTKEIKEREIDLTVSRDDKTPLHLALEFNNDTYAGTILHLQLESGQVKIDEPNAQGAYILHTAAERGSLLMTKLLIENGADVNVRDNYGRTPLHLAAVKQYLEVVQLLIDLKTPVDSRSNHQNTPLHSAAYFASPPMIKLLIRNKADVNAINADGHTPLHLAAAKGQTETIRELIRSGALVNAKDMDGSTPLHSAALYDKPETVEALIHLGADVDSRTAAGDTPLHVAAYSGHTQAVKTLIQFRAGVDPKNAVGETPLYNAASFGHRETVKCLIEHGADIYFKKDRLSPFKIATQNGHKEVADLLTPKRKSFTKRFFGR